jgi:eukaryotic-like serine/threonine-protein kinase
MNVGDQLGKYRLTRPLGGGAMGVVWAAINEDTNKEVALKLLPSPDEELRRRLLREAKACGRLEHRNIVAIYDTGITPQGEPFLVMQLLSGETLGRRLKREGRLSPETAAAIGAAVAAGLEAAHAENIIHRDLKPDNVFLHREAGSSGEVVKILDFGVSRVEIAGDAGGTATGILIGSPAYMSPEQARGSKPDPRSDLWSLGVVLFETLTGARPFPGPSIADAMVQVLTMPIPEVTSLVPGVPAGLSAIVSACLLRELENRPFRARDVAAWLLPHATPAPGQGNRVELPSLGGLEPLESTQVLDLGPPATTSGTVLMASRDDGRQLGSTPLSRTPLLGSTVLVEAAAPPPDVALAPPPSPALAPSGVGLDPRATASSSATPLTRTSPQPAPSAPRGAIRATPIALALGALAILAIALGILLSREHYTADNVAAGPPTAPPDAAPAPSAVASTSALPAVPPLDAPEPALASSAGVAALPRAGSSGTGELKLNSIPASRVLLDGRPLGFTPKVGLTVPAGPHTVVFVYATGERHTRSTSVLPGTIEVVADRLLSTPAPP